MVNPGTYLTQQDHRPFVDNANSKTQNGFMKNQGTTNVILRFDSCRIYAFKTVKTCICFSKISQKPFMLSADAKIGTCCPNSRNLSSLSVFASFNGNMIDKVIKFLHVSEAFQSLSASS